MITGKLYDWLKYLAQIALPALGTLYFTLAAIWGLEGGEEVVGSIMAIDLFLGIILGISQVTYNKAVVQGGDVRVNETGKMVFEVDGDQLDIESLGDQKEVRFKVKSPDGRGETAPK